MKLKLILGPRTLKGPLHIENPKKGLEIGALFWSKVVLLDLDKT